MNKNEVDNSNETFSFNFKHFLFNKIFSYIPNRYMIEYTLICLCQSYRINWFFLIYLIIMDNVLNNAAYFFKHKIFCFYGNDVTFIFNTI